MAKRLKLVVPTEITVRDIDMEVLDMVDRLSRRPGGPVSLTYRELAEELGKSQRTAFRAVESCLERGFLSSDSAFLETGAQIANSYTITQEGLKVLRAYRQR